MIRRRLRVGHRAEHRTIPGRGSGLGVERDVDRDQLGGLVGADRDARLVPDLRGVAGRHPLPRNVGGALDHVQVDAAAGAEVVRDLDARVQSGWKTCAS